MKKSTRSKRILNADDIKHKLLVELNQAKAGLSKKAIFNIFVIFAFVFAMAISVL